jgi:hypothetical protein
MSVEWNISTAADNAALKTMLNSLRAAGTGVQDIVFHPGVGYAVTHMITPVPAPPSTTVTFGKRPVDTFATFQDAYMLSSGPLDNFGSAETLLRDTDTYPAMSPNIGAALSKGITIVSASLNFYLWENAGASENIILILTRRDWVEAEISLAFWKAGTPWAYPGGSTDAADMWEGKETYHPVTGGVTGWVSIDVAANLQDWSDDVVTDFYGWTFATMTAPLLKIYSSEYTGDTSLRPYVSVEYY